MQIISSTWFCVTKYSIFMKMKYFWKIEMANLIVFKTKSVPDWFDSSNIGIPTSLYYFIWYPTGFLLHSSINIYNFSNIH